jgi:DNA repair exonuclease SbcCD nuclease subunit
MRIAQTGDWHIDETKGFDDLARVLDAFIVECRKAAVDAILIGGDMYHPRGVKRSTAREQLFVEDYLKRAAEIAPVIGCRGNHDVDGEVELFNNLAGNNPIWFAERPHTYTIRGADILCLPWFDKIHLAASLPAADADAGETTRRTIAAAQQLLLVLQAQAALTKEAGRIPIGLGHLLVAGSETSTGQILLGETVEISPFDLSQIGCAYFGLSHIHKHQRWFDGRIAYPGSPTRHDCGEPEMKGFCLVDIEGERFRNDFVELPARGLTLLECDWASDEGRAKLKEHGIDPNTFALGAGDQIRGALVRLRYRIRAEDLHLVDEDLIEKIFKADGAIDVKVEADIQHEVRIRSQEITLARSVFEKVTAYWASKSIDVDEATRARVREKLASLETPATKENYATA